MDAARAATRAAPAGPIRRPPRKARVREASAPYHHDSSRHGARKEEWHAVTMMRNKKPVTVELKFTYPLPPTEDEQREVMTREAWVCSACPYWKMNQGTCHAHWLRNELQAKFKTAHCPEILSAAISDTIKAAGKATGDWSAAAQIFEDVYVTRGGLHLCRGRGNRGVPTGVPNLKLGTSRFGNPFSGVSLGQNEALFRAYVRKNFHILTDAEVQSILASVP